MNVNHRACYTARHVGYKYRSTACNTGEYTVKRTVRDDELLQKKIQEITTAINDKLDEQLSITKRSRQQIRDQIDRLHHEIDTVLQINQTVQDLREDLRKVAVAAGGIVTRLDKIQEITGWDSTFSMQQARNAYLNSGDLK